MKKLLGAPTQNERKILQEFATREQAKRTQRDTAALMVQVMVAGRSAKTRRPTIGAWIPFLRSDSSSESRLPWLP